MLSEKIVRFAQKIIEELSELNLYHVENFNTRTSRATLARLKRVKASWWQLAKRLIMAYLIGKQLLLATLQYNSYFLAIKMNKLMQSTNPGGSKTFNGGGSSSGSSSSSGNGSSKSSPPSSPKFLELEREIAANEKSLAFFGHPFKNMAFFIECAQVAISAGLIAFYVANSLYSKYIAPLNISLMRVLADEKRELRILEKLIRQERKRAIHMAYYTRFYKQIELHENHDNFDEFLEDEMMGNKETTSVFSLYQYKAFILLLKKIIQNDSFIPIYRRPQWLAKLRRLLIQGSLGLLLALSGFYQSTMFIWYKSRLGRIEPATWAAILCHVELASLLVVLAILVHVASCMMLCVFIDLSYAATKLRETMDHCIDENNNLIRELRNKQESYLETLPTSKRLQTVRIGHNIERQRAKNSKFEIEQINENLLRVIVDYRLFIRHILPMRKFFSHNVTITACTFIAMPLFFIFHAPYWNRTDCIMLISLFWVAILWHDLQLVPVCYNNARVNLILNGLFKIMAHIAKSDQGDDINNNSLTYNPFIVSMIRRETSESKIFIDKLSIKLFNTPLGYRHLLTMHFWAALLSVHAFYAKNSANEASTSLDFGRIQDAQSRLGLLG